MSILDIIIIAAVIFFLVRGIYRGLVREVGSLAGVILGIWLGNLYHPEVAIFLKEVLPPGKYIPIVAFALIFLVILVLCNLLGWLFKKFFQKIFLGWVDRILGAGLALLKSLVLCYLLIVLITFLAPRDSTIIKDSRLAPVIISSYQAMIKRIPSSSQEKLKDSFEQKKEDLQQIFKGNI
jgi:membrane protein required for colicin V production